MKNLLITAVKIISEGSRFHDQIVDVLIEKGKITKIAKAIDPKDLEVVQIDGSGKYLAPGFFDLNANFGEPGLETKEDIYTGTQAAAAGGFTGVAVMPNTQPSLQSRSEIALVVNAAKGNLVDVKPVGTVSKKREGKEMAEMYDMQQTGAIAFSDGNHSIQQAGLMGRALLYAKGINALVISFAEDESISAGNKMNEGAMSTYLGMKGIPNLAEALMVARDLFLAEYNDSPIHFTTISTPEAVDLIKKAKLKGIAVTCDVAAHQLVFTDEDVIGFDSNYKVSPPLRTKKDNKVLLKALKEGVIDAVVSQHTPHEVEFKNVEFQIAKNGIIGLQTALPFLVKAGLSPELIVDKLSKKPREILKLEVPVIDEGEIANAVLFDLDTKWVLNDLTNKSKSKNSPVYDTELSGKAILVINNNKLIIND